MQGQTDRWNIIAQKKSQTYTDTWYVTKWALQNHDDRGVSMGQGKLDIQMEKKWILLQSTLCHLQKLIPHRLWIEMWKEKQVSRK